MLNPVHSWSARSTWLIHQLLMVICCFTDLNKREYPCNLLQAQVYTDKSQQCSSSATIPFKYITHRQIRIKYSKRECSFLFQKNKKKLCSNLVSVQLDFSFAQGTAKFVLQIFWFPIKIGLRLSKNKEISVQKQYQQDKIICLPGAQPQLLWKYLKFPLKQHLPKATEVEFMLQQQLQFLHMAPSYITNKPVISSEYKKQ